MARSIAAGVAGKNLCANPKCRKEFDRTRGHQPTLCPACREAGVKLPDVVKPSPGKKKPAAKKHPHPSEKKAKPAAKKHTGEERTLSEENPEGIQDFADDPRPAPEGDVTVDPETKVHTGGLVSGGIKVNLAEPTPSALFRALQQAGLKPKLRDLEDFFRAWSGGEEEAEDFWNNVAAAMWGYLYGKGLAA